MRYLVDIGAAHDEPQALERLYQSARRAHKTDEFRADLLTCYEESSDNILYAAWYYRLQDTPEEPQASRPGINWKFAVPLSIFASLIFWWLSDPNLVFPDRRPYLALYWAPIAMLFMLAFLTLAAGKRAGRAMVTVIGIAIAGGYITLFVARQEPITQQHYLDLMTFHLPLLVWIGIGISVMGLSTLSQERFAFLLKSLEALITAGIYLIAGVIFTGITFSLFDALDIRIPEVIQRLIGASGLGAIPLLALASVYDPTLSPVAQDFRAGLARLITTLMRLLLPLTLIVLVVYLFAIPTNFEGPFKDRDVLGIYSAMLFAVIGLLIGATPMQNDDLPAKYRLALRVGMIAVACLAAVVGVYALAAIVYRTIHGGLTMNRLALIGWDAVNIGTLALVIDKQLKRGRKTWVDSLHAAFSAGAVGYVIWTVFLIIVTPLVF